MKTIGVIGLGSAGMRHANNLRKLGCHVWGVDPDMEKRLDLGFDYTAPSIEHLKNADAFIIASPTALHAEHLEQLAFCGKPIFIEKPVADKMPIGMNGVIMVGYNLRWHSCVKKAKEWIDSGLIGEPLWSQFTCAQYNDKPAYLRDGVILNWSHEIDLALYLCGNGSVSCSSTRLNDGKDDLTDIVLQHDSGCRSVVHLDYVTPLEKRGFTICGTKANLNADLVGRHADYWPVDKTAPSVGFWDDTWQRDAWNEEYTEEMQAFMDRCDGKETIGCTGSEALKVLEICLAVRKQAGL